jgi:hypothetical protein
VARDLPDLRSLWTADLFQHFGVDVDAEANERAPLTAIAAEPCPRCGWWLAASDGGGCPACGTPAHSPTPAPGSTALHGPAVGARPQPGNTTP